MSKYKDTSNDESSIMSDKSRLSRIVRVKSMKEILKLSDGFVTGPTPQVSSMINCIFYGSECSI